MKNVTSATVTVLEAQEAVKTAAKLTPSVLAAFHLNAKDTLEVQTRKGKGSYRTVATYEAGKSYKGLNGIAAAYVAAESAPNTRRVFVPAIDRVLVKFAA